MWYPHDVAPTSWHGQFVWRFVPGQSDFPQVKMWEEDEIMPRNTYVALLDGPSPSTAEFDK